MIIDTHVHLGSREGYLEELMEMVDRLRTDKICLFTAGPGFYRVTNDDIMEAHLKYPNRIIPFYYLRLGVDEPRVVERAHRDGFRGLKLINPTANYNDESYVPVWERCEDLGMITLFHTGIVGRNPQQVHFDIDSSRMKVIYLDRIARKFQQMTMFVAHLGNPDHFEAEQALREQRLNELEAQIKQLRQELERTRKERDEIIAGRLARWLKAAKPIAAKAPPAK